MIKVDIWSDFICPFCYIGKKRLEAVAEEEGLALDVTWHSFELDPDAPQLRQQSLAEHIAAKYGMTLEESIAAQVSLAENAKVEGIDFQWQHAKPGNTFDAHRLAHLAQGRGLGAAMGERLFRAYMSEGQAISDRTVLARLAGDAGLDTDVVAAVLEGNDYADAVRIDEKIAREKFRVQGVPFFLLDGIYAVSGAQSRETFKAALHRAQAA